VTAGELRFLTDRMFSLLPNEQRQSAVSQR